MIGTYVREGVERVEKWCLALHLHLPPPPPQERSGRHKTVGVSGLRDRDAWKRKRRCETSGKVMSSFPSPPTTTTTQEMPHNRRSRWSK